ncbi:glycosyltransferase [Desulfovibrio sp. ZJ200]|uniref:glycosyltransferase family 8 protein n=1 Tax=Desulfovibrio sp. ZJ200 TaxID=2709792 RepID=UPI0013ED6A17|nr:glycosyltransferase [Desulfovibrio sp. ZJ200]
MKVVFCIDDNPRYLMLLKVAVRSLRAVQGAATPCLCVYAGNSPEVLAALAGENIPLARYCPRLSPAVLPPQAQANIGCFLKLELALVPELAGDATALYCDADVLFYRALDALADLTPPYMGMAREYTAPFYHERERLAYDFRGKTYTVPLPFPIWTFSSGVVLFNLERLRRHDLIEHFLAFSVQNVHCIGNLDQSLLNYFFGKRITRLEDRWNRPPYQADALDTAHIVHFHGPKPWDLTSAWGRELRINHFEALRRVWLGYLRPEERALVESWG